MKLANAIEGGLAGATTLSLLQEALHKIDSGAPRPLLHKSGIVKQLKKSIKKKKGPSAKVYIQLAGELLSNAAFFGLTSLGKKKNAILRGGVLGAAAGLGSAFLMHDNENKDSVEGGLQNGTTDKKNQLKKKLLTITLYTAGGMLAGLVIKKIGKKQKKKG